MELIRKYDTGVHPSGLQGCPAFNDWEKDLYLHKNVPGDSCFVVANVTGDDGNTYNFLIHAGALVTDSVGVMIAMVSLTDKASKEYIHAEKMFPLAECTFAEDHFDITSPVSSLKGSGSEFTAYGELAGGRGRIEARMEKYGPVLQNAGNGLFQCMVGKVIFNHYGLPYLKTEGTLLLDGKTIRFEGDAWLDRQWGSGEVPLPMIMAENKVQTKWMDLNISNGYKVSLWDIVMDGGIENSWATILSPDGITTLAPMTPLQENEEDYWYSEATGNYYPTRFVVEFPGLNTQLNVSVYDGIPQQEAVSVSGYNRYEAHSTFEGVFMGEKVTGFCCVELVGHFGQKLKGSYDFEEHASGASILGSTVPDSAIDGIYRGIMHSPMGDKDVRADYKISNGELTGSVTLLGKTTEIYDTKLFAGGFSHCFKMKLPVGIKTINVSVTAKVEHSHICWALKTPMGEMKIDLQKE